MIQTLNLSSRPYRNGRLPIALAVLLISLGLVGSVYSFVNVSSLKSKQTIAESETSQLKKELGELNARGEEVQQELTADQRALLIGAHKLIANKSFGWSRLFADLENLIPRGVGVSSVKVEELFGQSDTQKARLGMSVKSRDFKKIILMLENMQASGMFDAQMRSQSNADSVTVVELAVVYTPRNGIPAESESPKEVR